MHCGNYMFLFIKSVVFVNNVNNNSPVKYKDKYILMSKIFGKCVPYWKKYIKSDSPFKFCCYKYLVSRTI